MTPMYRGLDPESSTLEPVEGGGAMKRRDFWTILQRRGYSGGIQLLLLYSYFFFLLLDPEKALHDLMG